MKIADAQQLWSGQPGWLNTATYGLPPTPAWDALQSVLADWRSGQNSWEKWGEATDRSRESFARLVGARTDQVAVGATVSELIGLVAAGAPDRARVVTAEGDFTSLLFPWLVHADRGIDLHTVPVASLADAVDRTTTAVAFSLVQSATGQIADLDAVVQAARVHDALVVVDATQACGWLPVTATGIDALACGAYKWLMSPRGSAFLAVSDRLRDRLRPLHAGWYAGEDVHASYYGLPLRLARSARRFDTSPAWFSWVGTAPALEVVEQIGVEAIHAHNLALANRFRAGLGLADGDSAIVSAAIPDSDRKLAAAGIRAATRAGELRVSFHIYSTEDDVDTALNALTG
ncbi:MAG TPA: aminotransferase class V-fold PLP-dependent enzyme [Pseudonocardiaceae bacterium]|nr:aminotransferase class V-fold PLP-dependent enzyme [Pseudonocardiaceae bacterium]